METQKIENIIKEAAALEEVHVKSDDGSHFQIIAVGDIFAEMSRVKKQQLIYKPLSEYIASGSIHALSIKTYTCAEWQRQRKLASL